MEVLSATAAQSGTNHKSEPPVMPGPIALFDINWLCLYLVFLALPVIELLGLFSGQPASIPVPLFIAIDVFALIITFSGASRRAFMPGSRMHGLALVWFAISGVLIFCIAFSDHQLHDFFVNCWISLLLLLACAALIFCVKNISTKCRDIPSLSAGAAAVFCGTACVHGMLLLTIAYLHYVYDPVLYRFEIILSLAHVAPFFDILNSNHILKTVLFKM